MIVVIADDLSGAAEIGGVACRYGLAARIQTEVSPQTGIDVLILNSCTRSMDGPIVRNVVGKLAQDLNGIGFQWLYKKVDSVLRGHVFAELDALMQTLRKPLTILAPANPSKGRTIVNGQYRIDNRPLDQTDFANDPEFPAISSRVAELLKAPNHYLVHTLKCHQSKGIRKGIVIAETESTEDVSCWAASTDTDTLCAGGSDFFEALLRERSAVGTAVAVFRPEPNRGKKLIICGSASENSRRSIARARDLGIPIYPMPDELLAHSLSYKDCIMRWAGEVATGIRSSDCAMVAILQPRITDVPISRQLTIHLVFLVQAVIGKIAIEELFIEGGATAEAVCMCQGWMGLNALGEYSPGVVKLSIEGSEGPCVTIKPGSYPWPEVIWNRLLKGMSCAK
jgi:uncharacterized protein YgbK (DUF1537 family)